MKNNSTKLLALLCAGCIALSGCGDSDTSNTTETSAQTQENTEETITENAEVATETDDNTTQSNATATGTDSNNDMTEYVSSDTDLPGSSAADTTMPASSASTATEIPAPHADVQTGVGVSSEEQHTVVGIITDATTYSVAIQVPNGDQHYLTIPETGVTGNLDYLTIGQLATLTYTGSLDENHASLIGISSSSMITGIYVEEYAFALKIINACKAMDLEALSDLSNFPVFLETGKHSDAINTSGEFEAIDSEKIFTEALITRMANFNLFELQYTDAGFVMGVGTPSITFDVDDNGILGIIGINCNASPLDKEDSEEKKD